MFNFGDLSDVEFEELCRDIMQRKLQMHLQIYTKGRDGGIDICDSVLNPKVVIQVRHYYKSKYSALKTSLKKDTAKIKKINPESYYVCTSCGLTPGNKRDLYGLYSEYMESDVENILGVTDIDDYLKQESSKDILLKNYKLGFSAAMIPSLLHYDAEVDKKAFIAEMEEQKKFFVTTEAFIKVLERLQKQRIVILTGNPGSGKTFTSKMIVLAMAERGYKIIFVSDHNIKESKALLSQNESEKEIILLDDCFGQRYFELKDETGSELATLFRYVKHNKNKLLLMNSRVTIYREAQAKYNDLEESVLNKELEEVCIEMDKITDIEKAQIFYNHLYFNEVPQEYMDIIKANYNYRKIVKHRNYMPRLISRFTMKSIIESYNPIEYIDYIRSLLDRPKLIWEDEYNKRLTVEDRIFMNTLFSLTDREVSSEIHKRAFNMRVNFENKDTTVDLWSSCKYRLINSMIRVISKDGREWLSVADPSVNDYLETYLLNNDNERKRILEAASEYVQIKRINPNLFVEKVRDGSALRLNYMADENRYHLILTVMVDSLVVRDEYASMIKSFLSSPFIMGMGCEFSERLEVFIRLLMNPYLEKFNTISCVNADSIADLLRGAYISDYSYFFKAIEETGFDWIEEKYKDVIMKSIVCSVDDCIGFAVIEDYYQENPLELMKEYTTFEEYGPHAYTNDAAQVVMTIIKDNLEDEIYEGLSSLPESYRNVGNIRRKINDLLDISIDSIESYLEATMESSFDEDALYEAYRENHISDSVSGDGIDRIFR